MYNVHDLQCIKDIMRRVLHYTTENVIITLLIMQGGESIMISFKIDVLEALKDKGYSSARLRKENIISESVITDIRKNRDNNTPLRLNIRVIDIICSILKKQPGQILEYIPDEKTE